MNWLEWGEVSEAYGTAAIASAVLTVAAFSTASANASLLSITVESRASVGEPLPILLKFSGAHAVSPSTMNFSMWSGSNRRLYASFTAGSLPDSTHLYAVWTEISGGCHLPTATRSR
jgi:hypothetical protein